MTLNTFHLAGHGGANVTLGVPRLKELLTTKNTKVPAMIVPLQKNKVEEDGAKIKKDLQEVNLFDILNKISSKTKFNIVKDGEVLSSSERSKIISLNFELENLKYVHQEFAITPENISKVFEESFLPSFTKVAKRLLFGHVQI